MQASNLMKKKISHSVYDLRYIKPIDKTSLKIIFKKYKNIFVIEEHYENGGAYSTIIEEYNKIKDKRNNIFQ